MIKTTDETIEASIIIPVFNQWKLTRQCLATVAQTTVGENIEVIVIDNASTDETSEACPALGEALFGGHFVYRRAEKNLNFGPASNLGARIARGSTLIFLNNDTEALPGWFRPLLCDLNELPNVAATGPVLLYPNDGPDVSGDDGRSVRPGPHNPFGRTVQHIGVFISPFLKVGHIYEGIPEDSPLTKKRRFFQIITAACMAIRAHLFEQAGGFDERYINGFEDVDLCTRLWSKGLHMTVNPQSRVVHHTSQTPGRFSHDAENSQLARERVVPLFVPNLQSLAKNDSMQLNLSPWQILHPALPPTAKARLEKFVDKASSHEALRKILMRFAVDHPYWDEGLTKLRQQATTPDEQWAILEHTYRLFHAPEDALTLHSIYRKAGNDAQAAHFLSKAETFAAPFATYIKTARASAEWCASIGLEDMAALYLDWLARADNIWKNVHTPFMQRLRAAKCCDVALNDERGKGQTKNN